MVYIILAIVIIAAIYFAFRYFSLVYALRRITGELREIQKDLTQNQIVHLPVSDRHLRTAICAVNDTLEEIRKERRKYEKREKEFQKQIENISHDLRTPLTVILGYLKLLRRNDGAHAMDGETVESLAIIEQKAETMKNLVTQFYDYSRLNAGDYELPLNQVDISRTLRESLMGNYQVLQNADLEVSVDIPEHPIWAIGEETALERIFLNLLQNAGRYAKSFLRIAVKEEEEKVKILFVNDTSILCEDDLSHLFDRFYMQDSSRNQGGTGLGLTVAKSLAEEMGGTLEVHGAENHSGHDGGDMTICFHLCLKMC